MGPEAGNIIVGLLFYLKVTIMKNYILFTLLFFVLSACTPTTDAGEGFARFVSGDRSSGLSDYWYQGKAEINYYRLEQNRYDTVHPGEAVAVFVTEPFRTDKQVKDEGEQNPASTSVLKLNLVRRFSTGLYDYSIMNSIFTPTDRRQWPYTLKTTTSSQDWCGQSWLQLNYREDAYRLELRSYFEQEADRDLKISPAFLEDEIMNVLRMDPSALPVGDIDVLPASHFLLLRHADLRPYRAEASLDDYRGEVFTGENLKIYTLRIPELERELRIIFQEQPPYRIEGWEDTYPSAFDGAPRTTRAIRARTILEPYWQLNGAEDRSLRRAFGPVMYK